MAALVAAAVLLSTSLFASDHADPIDPFNRERLEGGITDLFFPILADGKPAFPFHRTDGISLAMLDLSLRPALTAGERSQIKGFRGDPLRPSGPDRDGIAPAGAVGEIRAG